MKRIKDIISNRNILTILLVLNLILITFLSTKAYYQIEIKKEKDFEDRIEEITNNITIYQDMTKNSNVKKGIAASSLVSCINSPIDTTNLPTNIQNIIKNIDDYYKQSKDYFSFKYQDIYTGFTVSYNESGSLFAASTIKAPLDIYIYELASDGKTNLDEKLTYYSKHYSSGTGILKNNKVNTSYTIRELVKYSILYSDNIAHNMLMEYYGRQNVLNFWQEKGTKVIFTQNNNWGNVSAYDAGIYMNELYNFYVENDEYGNELMDNFLGAKFKLLNGGKYNIANKTGWSGDAIHDAAIVFADNPYVLVALSKLGNNDEYQQYFNKISSLVLQLHEEYWKYKMNLCKNIIQY